MNDIYSVDDKTDLYSISPMMQLEAKGLEDGYYYLTLINYVFRCKIRSVLDNQLAVPLKRVVFLDCVDKFEQIELREKFKLQQASIGLKMHILNRGLVDPVSKHFYAPFDLMVDVFYDSVRNVDGELICRLSSLEINNQLKELFEYSMKDFSVQFIKLLDNLIKYFGMFTTFDFYSTLHGSIKDSFVIVSDLESKTTNNVLLEAIKCFMLELAINFNSPRPNLDMFMLEVNKLLVLDFEEESEFASDVKIKLAVMKNLSVCFEVIYRFSNFATRVNLAALVEFYEFLLFYNEISLSDSVLYEKLKEHNFSDKIENYLNSYLDAKRIYQLLIHGDRVKIINEINMLDLIINKSDFEHFDFQAKFVDKTLALKSAFDLF